MQPAHIIGITHLLIGLIVAGLSVPLILGKIPRNHTYGFRFAQSFESEHSWLVINRYGGLRLFWWSLAFSCVGGATLFLSIDPGSLLFWCLLSAPTLLLLPVVQTYRFGKHFNSESP